MGTLSLQSTVISLVFTLFLCVHRPMLLARRTRKNSMIRKNLLSSLGKNNKDCKCKRKRRAPKKFC